MKEKIAKWIKEGQGEKVSIEGKINSNAKIQLTIQCEDQKVYKFHTEYVILRFTAFL